MTSAYESGQVPPIEVRHRLRIAREYAELEQEELAELIGVSRTTIGNAETGRVKPRKITLNAWGLACGVPVSWIEKGGASNPPDHGLSSAHDDEGPNPRQTGNGGDQPSGERERPSYAAAA